jgi:hypothetical protein
MLTAGALMLIGVAWSARAAARGIGAAGLILLALGVAAARLSSAPPPPAFLAVNAGLMALGICVCVVAVGLDGWRPRGIGLIGHLAALAGAALGSVEVAPLVREAGAGRTAAAIAAMALVAWGWAWIGRRPLRSGARRPGEAGPAEQERIRLVGLVTLLLGALAVGLSGHIGLLLTGAMASGWGAWAAMPAAIRPRPYAPVLLAGLLGAALWLLASIAGPEGLAIAAIPSLPLSPAAERLVGLLLVGSAWILSGLWPWRQPAGGALTAPVGVWLLLRLGVAAVPAGLAHWRAGLFPLLVLGIWQAAFVRRVSTVAAGAALLGAASLDPAGLAGAGWLLAAAAALEVWPSAATGETGRARMMRVGIGLAAGWGTLGALTGGLRAEVTYTVLAAAGAAAVLSWRARSIPGPGRCVDPSPGRVHIAPR